MPAALDNVWSAYRHRQRAALARLLTVVSRGEHLAELRSLLAGLPEPTGKVAAFTGAGGVGKSTLVGRMIDVVRAHGPSVAVLACDPQSPLTGGALLGDRLRMPQRADDAGVFIRSVATASGQEAIPDHLGLMIELVLGFGFDFVLLETVGAGQGDTAVQGLADVLVVLVQPEAGDDIQWEKAGLLEVADLVVLNKADLPGSDRTEAQLKSLLNLPGCRDVPILRVSAAKGQGLEALYEHLANAPTRRRRQVRSVARLLHLAHTRLAEMAKSDLQAIAEEWRLGVATADQAIDKLLRLALGSGPKQTPPEASGGVAK